jgi:hypothetical protein
MAVRNNMYQQGKKGIPFALILLFSAFAISIFALGFGKGPFNLGEHSLGNGFDIASFGLGVWLFVIIAWWTRYRGKFDLFELPIWLSLNCYIQVIVNVWLFQRNIKGASLWLKRGDYGTAATQVVVLIGFGLTFLWIGYIITYKWLNRASRGTTQVIVKKPRTSFIVGIWFVTWLITLVATLAGFGDFVPGIRDTSFVWANYVGFIELINLLTTFILLLIHFRRPSLNGRIWLALETGSFVVLTLFIASRRGLLVFVYIFVSFYYATGKLAIRWVLPGVLILILVVPVATVFRSQLVVANQSSMGASASDASFRLSLLVDTVTEVLSESVGNLLEDTQITLQKRQAGILEISSAILVAHPRSLGFVGEDLLTVLPERLIPRFLWLDKPTGKVDIYNITALYYNAALKTSSTSGQFSDAYRMGGLPVVALWLFVLGVLGAWFYHRGPGAGNLQYTALYLVMLFEVLTYNGMILGTIITLIQWIFPAWLIMNLLMFRRERQDEPVPLSAVPLRPQNEIPT